MPRKVFVAGSASLLGRHLVALLQVSSEDLVVCSGWDDLSGVGPDDPMDEIWCLSGVRDGSVGTRRLLAALPQLGAAEFNFVNFGDDAAEGEVVEQCAAAGVDYRVFRPSLVVGEGLRPTDGEEFLRFLVPLLELKSEIEERLSEYFDYQALRCWAPPDVGLNLIDADQAAKIMLSVARRGDTVGCFYRVTAAEDISFTDLCELLGMDYDLSLLAVDDRGALNAVDRLFEERMGQFYALITSPGQLAGEDARRVAGVEPEATRVDEAAQLACFQAVRRRWQADLGLRRERAEGLFAGLEPRVVDRDGSEFAYYAVGTGEIPIVLINALGQGLHYWCRLVDSLSQRHRVLIWEPRATVSATEATGLRHHVEDLAAVLRQEASASCHLVGWCTGGKVAVEFYLDHPSAVSSIVFLNSAFKCLGSSKELDTAYDRNFEPLCQILGRRPETAGSVMKSLRSSGNDDDLDPAEETDAEALALAVLSRINTDLRHHVRAPFQSEASLVNYARQILDFWQYDAKERADQVRVPSLVVTSEYDEVASTAASREMASLFPMAKFVEIRGATHYCLYDRPEFIGGLLEDFFHESKIGGPGP